MKKALGILLILCLIPILENCSGRPKKIYNQEGCFVMGFKEVSDDDKKIISIDLLRSIYKDNLYYCMECKDFQSEKLQEKCSDFIKRVNNL